MEELLQQFVDKKIDVSCGSTGMFRGRIQEIRDGVLYLTDEDDRRVFISVAKIASFSECSDSASRPGFIA